MSSVLISVVFISSCSSPASYEFESMSFGEASIYSMNDYLGFPDGNTLKTHSVCFDDSLQQGYIAGILTPDVAVFRDDEVVSYVDTGMGVGDFEIKKAFCGNGVLLVVSDDDVVRIDGETLEIQDQMHFKSRTYADGAFANYDAGWVSFPNIEAGIQVIYDLASFERIGQVALVKPHMFAKSDGSVLAVSFEQGEGYSIQMIGADLSVSDGGSFKSASEFRDLVYLENRNEIWGMTKDDGEIFVYDLSALDKKPLAIATGLPDTRDIESDGEYVVIMTENGLDYDGYGNFLGGIAIVDAENKQLLHTLEMSHHHTSMDIDAVNHEVYVTNNSDNSASRIDLASGEEMAVIKAGSSAEDGVFVPGAGLYVTNRLGGNSLMHIDVDTGDFVNIEGFVWPLGVAYSESLDEIFVYDFLSSSIKVVDPDSDEIINTYDLGVSDGSTDGIGSMSYDHSTDIIYVSIPEQNVVVSMDAQSGEVLDVINVYDYLADSKDSYPGLSGPANLVASVYEENGKLFVYASSAGAFYVYEDGELVNSVDIEKGDDTKNFPYSFFIDQVHGYVYVGSNYYDVDTYQQLGGLQYGDAVAGIDYDRQVLFTASVTDDAQETLYAVSFAGELLAQVDMNQAQYVKARFEYDSENEIMYVFYMVPSEVWAYSVDFY
ncbi:hypothetical protein COT83_04940 [Candidatus Peregrinibacteria bacterium CG10_big_fil_rev_8_21_14_0_10_44_7]|nr:MAG: hypothetical protein AUK45_05115 [Candidatus Peregrinibacteria bacterium CG2_30_44_17]PIS03647.1 MAG: hypothetical protein COT83_04940 [Candidatus Peregrinibacteria bacterium CG10_big_fil_rev_8_21_14_0_10_44_7]PIX80149.1 MAG: hypothetical protein COZ35_01725 [Candidatus Peregrinibacteria bacterium CG_4_10_14_3_um_filter_44_21]PJB88779.1 MAG: hypothetical protein CO082_03425 [Candidatus Peregrinibacteria bacterium CG_4_9_14_0_8_um_filter_44_15]